MRVARFWSSTSFEYSLKIEYCPLRVECCSLKTVSGLNRWNSPSRRHWYSPPHSRSALDARAHGEGALMPLEHLLGDHVDPDAADARRGPGEVAVHEVLVEADRLEDLRAAIALERRDAHLGHHLEDALVERLDVVLDRLLVGDADEEALLDHVVQRLEREIRVDHPRAVAEEQRAVMHLARVAGFDDQRAAGPRALAHQMMVNACRREQARDRRSVPIDAPVRQDDDRVARLDRARWPDPSARPARARGPGRPCADRTPSGA